MKIEIPGKPIAKKRPRFARIGKFVKTYSDQKTEEGRFQIMAMEQVKKTLSEPLQGPINLFCSYRMPIPKSWHKKRFQEARDGRRMHTSKPDLDNLIKFSKDCLNSIAWNDDSQIVMVSAEKFYSDNPATVLYICESQTIPTHDHSQPS